MLHIVVAVHNPESCAAHSHLHDQHQAALNKLLELAPTKGMTVEGPWVDPAAHTAFCLIDSPNAHAITEAMMASGLMALWTFTIHPVIENAIQALPRVA